MTPHFFPLLLPLVGVLGDIENMMSSWGYPILFGLLFSCGLGVPLPEDIPLLIAGYFVATGKMHLYYAAACAWCGIIGGDCVLYNLGKKYGTGITRVPFIGKHITTQRIENAELLFDRYGTWVVGFGRLFAGIRAAMVIAAGATRFSFIKFVITDGFAAIISGGLFIGLGYWAGRKLGDLEAVRIKIEHYERYVVGAVLLVLLLTMLYKISRRRRHRPPMVDAALEKAVEKAESAPHRLI